MACGDDAILRVVEGKLARLTHDIPTLRIYRIPMIKQEYVVGVPSTWLCLLRRVARVVLHYREVVKAVVVEEVKDQA